MKFRIEKDYLDYHQPEGTILLEPAREVLRMGGMLSDEERKKVQEAQSKLKEFESQLAAMPANQRAMMENMIGPQINKMKSLASGGGVEFEILTTEVIAYDADGKRISYSADPKKRLVQIIQEHLTTLGYHKGRTDGIFDKATKQAISKYQSAQNMPATGNPSQALADKIATSVAAKE